MNLSSDMPGEETILARRQRLSLLPRACEACKIRKIRCDRSHPCGNCRSSGITCQQANATPDTRPKSDRVAQLEEHVAILEARLAKVELRLGSADTTTSALKQTSASSSVSPAAGSLSEPQLHEVSPSGVSGLYEGSTSFLNQSVQASEVAQRTATSGTPEAAQIISESFGHLESLLRSGADLQTHRLSNDIASRSVPNIAPLPAAVVIAVLRKLKARPSLFISGHAVTDVPLVEYLCQRVYFPTESVSIGHITSVSGILHWILREYEITQASLGDGWDIKQLVTQAGQNFDLGIESFELLTVPSFENVLALTLAVIRAQTETKPVLFRALLASACGHCQMLGYHRESTFQKDRSPHTENKRRIFWMLYVYDKSDSLLFGHTSKIQDFDIDARPPTPSSDPAQRPWDDLFCQGIGLSRVQGQIYDKLYSVTALQSPAASRKQSIDALTTELLKWRNDFDQWDAAGVHFVNMADLAKVHWDIVYYSTLTSLLRAPVTPGVGTDISSQCFQAARLGLHSHLRCFSGYGGPNWVSRSEYVNWALHNSSFTPFVVIFLHSIAASSMEDVQLLDQVVETLESARNSQAGTERQYQICVTFARLARRMVEARNTCVGMYDQNTDSLQVAGVSEDVPLNWPEAFIQPSGQQVEPGGFSGFLDDDMSSILANWINGQPQATDMFGMEFGE